MLLDYKVLTRNMNSVRSLKPNRTRRIENRVQNQIIDLDVALVRS